MSATRYLAFETGGTKLVAAVANAEGRLIETRRILRGKDDRAKRSFARLCDLGAELRTEHEARGGRFAAIGFGFGGVVRRSTRDPFLCLHEEGWDELEVVQTLEERFGLPAAIENDCKLAALAEACFGAGRGARTIFYMTVGTGIGGGIVRDGRIVAFSDSGEAEIGHIVVEPDGPPCCCGGRGCVESLCSGPGIAQLGTWLAEREGRPLESTVSSKRYMELWQKGDDFATRVIEQAAEYLATAAAAAVNLIAPEVFVVGGGVGAGNPPFLKLIDEKTRPRVAPYFREHYRLVRSELDENVVAQGAAILARQSVS